MKKIVTAFIVSLLINLSAQASVSIVLQIGQLTDKFGNPVADNTLIQLISAGSNATFSAPTASSFANTDDILLSQFGLNSSTVGIAGSFTQNVSITLTLPISANQLIMLRWFPDLTTASSTPGGGASYGEYRDVTSDWILPTDGGTINPTLLTSFVGGSIPNSFGQATLSVIPEPSTYALLGGLAGLGWAVVRRRRA